MQEFLSERVKQMAPSATLAMAAKTRELRAQGKDIIGLSLGEPDFNVPDFIKKAAIEAIEQNYSKYTAVDGYLELKQAICEKFLRDNQLHYTPEQIVVSNGAKQCITNVAMVLLNPGDEVILPAPYWVSYQAVTELTQGVAVSVKTSIENDFKMTPEQLRAAITPKTKLIIFSSPCNPSGSVYSREELEKLAQVLRDFPHIFVLSDEIYEYINFGGKHASMAQIEGMFERTITVNGVSKAFAMTGWRIGYLGAPTWIAKACTKIQGQITGGANSVAQRASIVAVKTPASQIQYMIDEFHKRRDLVLSHLREIKGIQVNKPQGAFYVFPNVSYFFGKTLRGVPIRNASDFSLYLLEHAGVATVTGEAFGDDNCIRISYAASQEELTQALQRIKEALTE